MRNTESAASLVIEGLNVHYGQAHALQDVSLSLDKGALAVVGRNGMGKSTLCKAITGIVPATGSVRFCGQPLLTRTPDEITHLGVGYVPQGRRVWRSLTVDETLRLAAGSALRGAWTVDRVYQVFPRLAERRANGGALLSGGEQQMLAIGRALLFNPRLLVMDEPTEGLAPVIVEQVATLLKQLAADGEIAVLLIEQNLGVALEVADRVAVMVNGRIVTTLLASELAADRALQQRLLGVSAGAADTSDPQHSPTGEEPRTVLRLVRHHGGGDTTASDVRPWPSAADSVSDPPAPATRSRRLDALEAQPAAERTTAVRRTGLAGRAAYVVGTFDTKGPELMYLRQCLDRQGLRTVTVDLSTSEGTTLATTVSAREVAAHHPGGVAAIFSGQRGAAVTAMAEAFARFILSRDDLGGVISAGGSGGTALATAGMRVLPVGTPKLMVSTVASGDTRAHVGGTDICLMHAVTDVQGLNSLSTQILGNAAHALAGMLRTPVRVMPTSRPAVGVTMFGVTTPCVQAVAAQLENTHEVMVFHATGTGGQAMERLAAEGRLSAVLDVTTTEFADEIAGGVFSAGPTRLDALAATGLPYVGSCGALDMVNFHALATVPERYRRRQLMVHNPAITLMRTSVEECRAIGVLIAEKLNALRGPVCFLIPEGGVSALDAPGQAFWNPEANTALFDALQAHFRAGPRRTINRLPLHINDPAFAKALVVALRDVQLASARATTA